MLHVNIFIENEKVHLCIYIIVEQQYLCVFPNIFIHFNFAYES